MRRPEIGRYGYDDVKSREDARLPKVVSDGLLKLERRNMFRPLSMWSNFLVRFGSDDLSRAVRLRIA